MNALQFSLDSVEELGKRRPRFRLYDLHCVMQETEYSDLTNGRQEVDDAGVRALVIVLRVTVRMIEVAETAETIVRCGGCRIHIKP